MMAVSPPMSDPPAAALRAAADRAVDALVDCAVEADGRVGWPSWQLDAQGWPLRLTGGDPTVYDGDAGVAWALAELGAALDRADAVALAGRAVTAALASDASPAPGLLDGRTGIVMAAHHVQARTGERVPGLGAGALLPDTEAFDLVDLTAGLAGLGVAQARTGCTRQAAASTVACLRAAAQQTPVGLAWSDRTPAGGRTLCGLSHGASGIALAAAELAGCHDELPGAAAVIAGAVRWESTWFDPLAGGWPDLREDGGGHPAQWCHGAGGIGIVRLRLLELTDRGVDVGVPVEQLEVDAQVAVQACGRHVASVGDALHALGPHPSAASTAAPGGLTLCHGLGGAIEVLLQAHLRWGVDRHLELARDVVSALLQRLGEDPLGWPSGLRAVESAGLMVGLAGTALLLARLGDPAGPAHSPALLGA